MLVALAAAPAQAVPLGSTVLVSRPSDPATLPSAASNDGGAWRRAVSSDGRYVVFDSLADGLSAADNDNVRNVYMRDRQTNETFLISRTTDGAAANGNSSFATVNATGTRVAFESEATNLDPADTNADRDIYVRNIPAGTTTLVSRDSASQGNEVGNGPSTDPAISGDGNEIAFTSRATNFEAEGGGDRDVFVRIDSSDTTRLVSRRTGNTGAVAGAGNDSFDPAINSDGTKIAFTSEDPFDTTNDTNTHNDVYVRDDGAMTRTTTLVSRAHDGGDPVGNLGSQEPAINGDGTKVAFSTQAFNLADGDTSSTLDIHVRDITNGTTEFASRGGAGDAAGDADSSRPAIDGAGDTVVFRSLATNLSNDDPEGGTTDVYLRDLANDETALVSRASAPGNAGLTGSNPALSADGTVVTFTSGDDAATPDDADDFFHVYARDLNTQGTALVDRPSGTESFATGANNASTGTSVAVNVSGSSERTISADGRFVVFESQSDGLSPADNDAARQIFRRDVVTGETVLISQSTSGAPGNAGSDFASISADGNRVAFESQASNLIPGGDVNGPSFDVFVRDVSAGTLTLVSRRDGADGAQGSATSNFPVISADGNRVAFDSNAQLTGDDPDSGVDVYVRDLGAGTTTLASVGPNGKGDDFSTHAAIDADGSTVAFITEAGNFDPQDPGSDLDVYVRDLTAGTTSLVSRGDGGGPPGNDRSDAPSLSADGMRVAFESDASNLGTGDAAGLSDVFVRDLASGRTLLVSRDAAGNPGDGHSTQPAIALAGNRVAFTSAAANLGNAGAPGATDAFVHDLADGSTTLMSRADGAEGAAGNASSSLPALSADGACGVFTSNASNLVAGGYATTDFTQVYLRALSSECPAPIVQPPPDVPPELQRFSITNKRFRVGGAAAAGKRRRAPKGTRWRWTLSEAATVTIRIQRAKPGRRKGKRCVKPTRKLAGARKCKRWVRVGTLTHAAEAGAGGRRWNGRIRRRKLKRGSYRAVARAADPAGNLSRTRRVAFKIVRR